jgi:hypothetical protein
VLGPLGLEITDCIPDVMHELNLSDTQIIGRLERLEIAVQEARTLDREHDMRIALERERDVGRRSHNL